MNTKKLFEQLNKAEQALKESVGYVERWREYPLDNALDVTWTKNSGGIAYIEDGYEYGVDILHGPYEGAGVTAYVVDTGCDVCDYLMFLDNAKKVTEEAFDLLLRDL